MPPKPERVSDPLPRQTRGARCGRASAQARQRGWHQPAGVLGAVGDVCEDVRSEHTGSDGGETAFADCVRGLRAEWIGSREDAAHAVLDHAGEDLAADATHAHVPARGRKLVRPLLLGVAVAAR